MTRSEAEKTARRLSGLAPASAFAGGVQLLREDFAEELFPVARKLARRHPDDARMQQLYGLAARATNDSASALQAFANAARLAPNDALIAHSHARAAIEAGRPAIDLFEHAARLAPMDGSVLLGRAAALLQQGRAQQAIDDLSQTLASNPLWLDGHRDLASLLAQSGRPATHGIDRALETYPRNPDLLRLRITLLLEAGTPDLALAMIADTRETLGDTADIRLIEAHCLSETGDLSSATRLFSTLACTTPQDASLKARHLLKADQPDHAQALLEPFIATQSNRSIWPYLSLAWRLTDDERWRWLEGDPRLVAAHDLGSEAGDPAVLADALRALHTTVAQPLDQSVRGGTQTDGNLLLRLDPAIRTLRKAVMRAVSAYVASLPGPEEGHPTLLGHRTPRRIAGSWSVRLRDAGFHTDHVHSQGWISSAFYAALPENAGEDPHAGWLSLGECRELVPGLAPLRMIEPRVGRLVLFPSVMWHGTRPFASGERLTMAFDIAPPKQG